MALNFGGGGEALARSDFLHETLTVPLQKLRLLSTSEVKKLGRVVDLDPEALRGFKSWRRVLQKSD